MSNPDDPLDAPVPRFEDDNELHGTISTFRLTAIVEHTKANHGGEFEACADADCVQAREMLDGKP